MCHVMRLAVLLLLLAVSARSEVHLRYTTDLFGKYLPSDNSGNDCHLSRIPPPPMPRRMELYDPDEEDEGEWDKEDSPTWGNCTGGVPRLAWLRAHREENISYVSISGGNVLGAGPWELPVGSDAAAVAASLYDTIGLGSEEFRRGELFLSEYLKQVKRRNKQVSVLACNLKSKLLQPLVVSSKNLTGACNGQGCGNHSVGIVGFVDADSLRQQLGFVDPSLRFSNLSCVRDQVQTLTKPVIGVGSVSSLERLEVSGLLDMGLKAIVVSGLSAKNKTSLRKSGNKFHNHDTYILATDSYGKKVGDFELSKNVSSSIDVNSAVKDDNNTLTTMLALQKDVDGFYNRPVRVFQPLAGSDCSSRECSLADLITDAMLVGGFYSRLLAPHRPDHPNPIAVWPGAVMNGALARGNSSVAAVYQAMQDPGNGASQVALATAPGAVVIQLFARAVANITQDFTRSVSFLQVSGVKVTYDLDLAPSWRAKYLQHLCFTCSPQEYIAVSPQLNYTILLPVSMLADDSAWRDISRQFYSVEIAEFQARDVVATLAKATGVLYAPLGDRIEFTHLAPDRDESGDTFVTALVSVVVCMVAFGMAVLGFRVWSRRQARYGSMGSLVR